MNTITVLGIDAGTRNLGYSVVKARLYKGQSKGVQDFWI